MSGPSLDELDFGILHLLQEDARHQTPVDMADELPVTDNTVRNRIEKMESQGVIQGYVPVIDYERAGFPIRLQFTCTAPVDERSAIAEEALTIPHVVRVEEMLTAQNNVQILAITREAEALNEISSRIDGLGVTIENESLQRRMLYRPFNHFGESVASGD